MQLGIAHVPFQTKLQTNKSRTHPVITHPTLTHPVIKWLTLTRTCFPLMLRPTNASPAIPPGFRGFPQATPLVVFTFLQRPLLRALRTLCGASEIKARAMSYMRDQVRPLLRPGEAF